MFRASKFAFVDTLVAIMSDVKIFLFFLFLTLLVRRCWRRALTSQALAAPALQLVERVASHPNFVCRALLPRSMSSTKRWGSAKPLPLSVADCDQAGAARSDAVCPYAAQLIVALHTTGPREV